MLSTAESGIAVVHAQGEFHVVAMAPYRAGDVILEIEGTVVEQPSQYSIQIDDHLHIEPFTGEPSDHFERHPWRFLNHSCAPTAVVRGRELIATVDLALWDEITFNYNTTEYTMRQPFVCRCAGCPAQTIGGFAGLEPAEREALRPLLSEHLRRRLPARSP